MKHKAIAIIPARGGSKRIPNKNLTRIGGDTLLERTIHQAKKSKFIGDVYVTSDDEKILAKSKKLNCGLIKRPKHLSTDKSSTLDAIKHSINYLSLLDFDTVVVLQPTSPFRTTETIDKGIAQLWNRWHKLDAVFAVVKSKFPPNWLLMKNGLILEFYLENKFEKIRSQDLPKTYEINGELYVLKKELVEKSKDYPFSKNRTGFVVAGKIESIDVDDQEDLLIARSVAKLKSI